MRFDVGVSLFNVSSQFLQVSELLGCLQYKCQEMREPYLKHEVQMEILCIKRDIGFILLVLAENTRDCLDNIHNCSKVLVQITRMETIWIEKQKNFLRNEDFYNLWVSYQIDTLLVLLNLFNDKFLENTFYDIMGSQEKLRKVMYEFASGLISSLGKLFFDRPSGLLCHNRRLNAIQRLSDTFSITLPAYIKITEQIIAEQTPDTDTVSQLCDYSSMLQYWGIFKSMMIDSKAIQDLVGLDSSILSQSIWNIEEMYIIEKGRDRDLIIQTDDIFIRILNYLNFSSNAQESN